jgi:hypothetical protein
MGKEAQHEQNRGERGKNLNPSSRCIRIYVPVSISLQNVREMQVYFRMRKGQDRNELLGEIRIKATRETDLQVFTFNDVHMKKMIYSGFIFRVSLYTRWNSRVRLVIQLRVSCRVFSQDLQDRICRLSFRSFPESSVFLRDRRAFNTTAPQQQIIISHLYNVFDSVRVFSSSVRCSARLLFLTRGF